MEILEQRYDSSLKYSSSSVSHFRISLVEFQISNFHDSFSLSSLLQVYRIILSILHTLYIFAYFNFP